MTRKSLLISLGLVVAAVGVVLFARFWSISGTETPPGATGIVSSLDWGTFFISPILVLGGVSIAAWATLSGRGHGHPAPTSGEIRTRMLFLESTH